MWVADFVHNRNSMLKSRRPGQKHTHHYLQKQLIVPAALHKDCEPMLQGWTCGNPDDRRLCEFLQKAAKTAQAGECWVVSGADEATCLTMCSLSSKVHVMAHLPTRTIAPAVAEANELQNLHVSNAPHCGDSLRLMFMDHTDAQHDLLQQLLAIACNQGPEIVILGSSGSFNDRARRVLQDHGFYEQVVSGRFSILASKSLPFEV